MGAIIKVFKIRYSQLSMQDRCDRISYQKYFCIFGEVDTNTCFYWKGIVMGSRLAFFSHFPC